MLLVRSHCRAIEEAKYDEENLKVDVGADGTEPEAVESSSGLLLAACGLNQTKSQPCSASYYSYDENGDALADGLSNRRVRD
jgi:hypothetical protein